MPAPPSAPPLADDAAMDLWPTADAGPPAEEPPAPPAEDAGPPPDPAPDAGPVAPPHPPAPVACADVAPLTQELTHGHAIDCTGTAPCDDAAGHPWCSWHPTMEPVGCTYYAALWAHPAPTCHIPGGWCARAQDDAGCYAQGPHAPFASAHAVPGRGWVIVELARMGTTHTGAQVCPLRCP